MRSASVEWMARVSARNEIETAKALGALKAVPLRAGGLAAKNAESAKEVR